MFCRLLTILALASGCALASLASAQTAPGPAEPAPPEAPPAAAEAPPAAAAEAPPAAATVAPPPAEATAAPAAPAAPSLAGFEVLASAGYGPVTEVQALKIQPYGTTFGLHVGYTWNFGLRVGAAVSFGLGAKKSQNYENRGRERELTIDSHSVSSFVSVGYDLWLHFLILRYSLGLGVTYMGWELGNTLEPVEGYTAPTGSATSFVIAPSLAVLMPLRPFEIGVGFDYFFQADVQTPSGLVVQLLAGVKL